MPDNQDQFDQLRRQYGTSEQIPDEVLYNFLQEIRQDLVNFAKLGSNGIPESILGKEVRRRSETDLFWMARYLTWETNPHSEKGTKPISENLIDEEHYR